MVFIYLDVFGIDKEVIEEMKVYYCCGGFGDVKIKWYFIDVLEVEFVLICVCWEELEKDFLVVMEILCKGSEEVVKVVV